VIDSARFRRSGGRGEGGDLLDRFRASIEPAWIEEALEAANDVWPLVPDESLCIVDRNFLSAAVLIPIAAHGHRRHWLIRAKSDTEWKVLRSLGRGDWLVEKEVSRYSRDADRTLPHRWEMRERIAEEARVTPDRISFKSALMYIEHALLTLSLESAGRIPEHLRRLREDVAHFILPKRRQRSYPRAVKIKMSAYPRKRRGLK
jgi:hypothetical protein